MQHSNMPFRKASSFDNDSDAQAPTVPPRHKKGGSASSIRNLFGGKKKNKLSMDGLTIDDNNEVCIEKKPEAEQIMSPTEHTVTSVGSAEDVSSSEDHSESTHSDPIPTPAAVAAEKKKEEIKAQPAPVPVVSDNDEPACYLVYEPDSSGRLVEHYSKAPVEGAVGRFVPGNGKKIAPFKMTRNAGRNVLIGNCSAGVQGRRNYCNGWCQFVKSCVILQGSVTLFDVPDGFKGMPVDVYLYYDDTRPTHQTQRLEPGKPLSTDKLLAVACIPSGPAFFENMSVDIMKWLQDARNRGYSTKI